MAESSEIVLCGPKEGKRTPLVSLGEHYVGRLQEYGDSVALAQEVDDLDVTMTYWELLRHGKAVAGLLREYHLGVDDTLMVCCGNTLDFAPVMLGTFFIGAALAPVDPAFDTKDMFHVISIINPKLIICNNQSLKTVQEALTQYHPHVNVTTIEAVRERLDNNHQQHIKDFHLGNVEDPDKHVALVMCSSDTTGRSKCVELTDHGFLHVLYSSFYPRRVDDVDVQQVCLNTSGPFRVYCHLMTLYALCNGSKLVLVEEFTPENCLRVLQKFQINFVSLGPEQLVLLARHEFSKSFNLSSLRTVIYGGSPMSRAILESAEKTLGHKITVVYDTTECMGVLKPDYDSVDKIGNSGRLAPQVEAKVVDLGSGLTVGPNHEGELCFKTDAVFKGYRGNPQATEDMFDDAGFLHTGDVGYYDAYGYFYVIDRCKDMFKYRGIPVSDTD